MLTQLNPPMPLKTPKGKALAYFMIDYGIDHDLYWICFLESTGECWTFKNPEIRAQLNITEGRDYISPFYDPNDVKLKNERLNDKKNTHYFEDVSNHFKKEKPCDCEHQQDSEPVHQQTSETKYSKDWTPWCICTPCNGKFLFQGRKGKIYEGKRKGSLIELPDSFDFSAITVWYQEEFWIEQDVPVNQQASEPVIQQDGNDYSDYAWAGKIKPDPSIPWNSWGDYLPDEGKFYFTTRKAGGPFFGQRYTNHINIIEIKLDARYRMQDHGMIVGWKPYE